MIIEPVIRKLAKNKMLHDFILYYDDRNFWFECRIYVNITYEGTEYILEGEGRSKQHCNIAAMAAITDIGSNLSNYTGLGEPNTKLFDNILKIIDKVIK